MGCNKFNFGVVLIPFQKSETISLLFLRRRMIKFIKQFGCKILNYLLELGGQGHVKRAMLINRVSQNEVPGFELFELKKSTSVNKTAKITREL